MRAMQAGPGNRRLHEGAATQTHVQHEETTAFKASLLHIQMGDSRKRRQGQFTINQQLQEGAGEGAVVSRPHALQLLLRKGAVSLAQLQIPAALPVLTQVLA